MKSLLAAVDLSGSASDVSRSIGSITFYVLIGIVVIWVILRIAKKK